MNQAHYSEEILLNCLDGPGHPEYDELQLHLLDCPTCRQLHDSLRELFAAMRDPAVWNAEEPRLFGAEPDPEKLLAFLEHSAQLASQDTDADTRIPALLEQPSQTWRSAIEGDAALQTVGSLRRLAEEARRLLLNAPALALELSTILCDVAARLPEDSSNRSALFQLRGLCWKERANSLRYLGRYRESLKALDEAETNYSQCVAGHYDLAVVAYARGTMLYELEQIPEALALAKTAAETFLSFRDMRRFTHARILEGIIHTEKREFARARDVFESLLKPARAANDLESLASLFDSLGKCYIELGEPETAGTYLLQAMLLYKELGMEVARVFTQWGIGRLLVSTGKTVEAYMRLSQVRQDLEKLGNKLDAGLVTLDLAEALIASGRPTGVAALCQDLFDRFTEAGMPNNAMTALAYLQEAVEAERATPKVVRHVRHFLEELQKEPARLFAPPPSPL